LDGFVEISATGRFTLGNIFAGQCWHPDYLYFDTSLGYFGFYKGAFGIPDEYPVLKWAEQV
jgi:hypothetical protein